MNSKYLYLLFAISLLTFACNNDPLESNNGKINFDLTGEVLQGGHNCLVHDESDPNNKYIRIDSTVVYGFGITYLIPDSIKDSDIKLIINGKMRESDNNNGSIAISINDFKDSLVYWTQLSSTNYIRVLNNWGEFRDSLIIPKSINNSKTKVLKIFPFKNRGKGTYDVDDLVIELIKQ